MMLLNFTMVATCLIGLALPGPGVAFNADSDPTWLAIDSLEEQDCGKELGKPCRQYANVKVCSEQVNGKCIDGKSETVSSAEKGRLQFEAQTQSSGGDWATIGKGATRTLQVPWNQGLQKQMDNGKYHAVLRRLNSVFRAMADQNIDVNIDEKDQTFQDTMAKAHAKVGDVIRNLKLPSGINIVTPPLGYTHKSPAGNLSKGYAYLSHTPTQMPENPGKDDMYKITVQHVDCDFIQSSEKSAKNTNDRENFITNMNTAFAGKWCNVAKSCLPPGVMKKYIDIVADDQDVPTRLNSAPCTQGSDTDCTDACTKSAKKNKQEEACFCLDPDTDLPVV